MVHATLIHLRDNLKNLTPSSNVTTLITNSPGTILYNCSPYILHGSTIALLFLHTPCPPHTSLQLITNTLLLTQLPISSVFLNSISYTFHPLLYFHPEQ